MWRTKLEGKVRFYIWLLLQNRNWTADRLQARGWPHTAYCRLCDQEPETAEHITLRCSYAREVWYLAQGTSDRIYNVVHSAISVSDWWKRLYLHRGAQSKVAKETSLSAYIAWHLWKERNRRVFENAKMTPRALGESHSRRFQDAQRGLPSFHSGGWVGTGCRMVSTFLSL